MQDPRIPWVVQYLQVGEKRAAKEIEEEEPGRDPVLEENSLRWSQLASAVVVGISTFTLKNIFILIYKKNVVSLQRDHK